MIDGEKIAPGFELFSPDSSFGEITESWVVTGVLPARLGEHYDMEDALIREGILERKHCDSESGQFFVYPPDEEAARKVGAFIAERIERANADVWA